MANLTVREAQPVDEQQALAVIAAAMQGYRDWAPRWSAPSDVEQRERERWRERIETSGWLVAEEDRRVIGVCHWREEAVATLSLLMVDPAHQGRGVGHALHERALRALSQSGTRTVRLTVPVENRRARRFYEHRGWHETTTAPTRHSWLGLRMLAYERSLDHRGRAATAQQPELVIFDCDGVLVDSLELACDLLAEMLSEQGLKTTSQQARKRYKELLLADVVAQAQHELGRALPDDWLQRYECQRAQAFRASLAAMPNAAEAVRRVQSAGARVCVASQGKLEKTRLSLELTGLLDLFGANALFSAYSVARGKPHLDVFLHAAAAMGVQPHRCAVVEDSPSGVRAALAAGMRAIGYPAAGEEASLRDAGASEIVSSLTQLPRLLSLSAPA
jgi:HAD superfamily hydrolase (TIGR01509 family)